MEDGLSSGELGNLEDYIEGLGSDLHHLDGLDEQKPPAPSMGIVFPPADTLKFNVTVVFRKSASEVPIQENACIYLTREALVVVQQPGLMGIRAAFGFVPKIIFASPWTKRIRVTEDEESFNIYATGYPPMLIKPHKHNVHAVALCVRAFEFAHAESGKLHVCEKKCSRLLQPDVEAELLTPLDSAISFDATLLTEVGGGLRVRLKVNQQAVHIVRSPRLRGSEKLIFRFTLSKLSTSISHNSVSLMVPEGHCDLLVECPNAVCDIIEAFCSAWGWWTNWHDHVLEHTAVPLVASPLASAPWGVAVCNLKDDVGAGTSLWRIERILQGKHESRHLAIITEQQCILCLEAHKTHIGLALVEWSHQIIDLVEITDVGPSVVIMKFCPSSCLNKEVQMVTHTLVVPSDCYGVLMSLLTEREAQIQQLCGEVGDKSPYIPPLNCSSQSGILNIHDVPKDTGGTAGVPSFEIQSPLVHDVCEASIRHVSCGKRTAIEQE